MPDYQKMYTTLFNAITDALNAIDAQNLGVAKDLLRRAQLQAEELYLAAGEPEGENAEEAEGTEA